MTSGKIKAVLFIIVFLLIVAVLASWFVSRDETGAPAPEPAAVEAPPADDTLVVVTPEPTAVLITPQPTPVATPKPTPAPTPVPTPAPTPAPLFDISPAITTGSYGDPLGSGSFSSSYGLGIDLVSDWSVSVVDAESVSVTVTVSVQSGTLYSGPVPLGISVGGQYQTLTANSVNYDSTAVGKHTLGSQSFTAAAPAGQVSTIPVQASWHFGGSYGGNELPVLECGGTISVKR